MFQPHLDWTCIGRTFRLTRSEIFGSRQARKKKIKLHNLFHTNCSHHEFRFIPDHPLWTPVHIPQALRSETYQPSMNSSLSKRASWETSLAVQWLRIHLPMKESQVRSLIQEDLTCCSATKPVSHRYWAHALQSVLYNKRSHPSEKPTSATETQHGPK